MSSSMNINGVAISSSKNGMNISSERVQFSDGSWVDTKTGQAENRGRGTLIVNGRSIELGQNKSINGPSMSKPKTINESYDGISHLVLDINSFDISVSIAAGPITVKCSGDSALLDSLKLSQSKKVLSVSDTGSSGGTTINIGRKGISIGGVSFSGGSVTIGGSSGIILDITVPEGTTIDAKTKGANSTTIADTKANLAFEQTGSGSAVIGDVAGAELTLSGSGGIRVSRVVGNMSVSLPGSGSITVREATSRNTDLKLSGLGTINVTGPESTTQALNIKLSGSGKVLYRGTSENGEIKLSGMGDVNVHKIVNKPTTKKSGMGHLVVGNWMG